MTPSGRARGRGSNQYQQRGDSTPHRRPGHSISVEEVAWAFQTEAKADWAATGFPSWRTAEPWLSRGFTALEAQQWHERLFTPAEAVEWNTRLSNHGAETASVWRNAMKGDIDLAARWFDQGVGAGYAAGRHAEGFTPEQGSKEWEDAGLGWREKAGWSNHGFLPVEAAEWVDAGIPLVSAVGWRRSDITPAVAAAWEAEKVYSYAYRMWADAGTTDARVAGRWHRLYPDDLPEDVIQRWRDATVSPSPPGQG